MLIVGSKALKYNFPNFNREVNDTDIIGNMSDFEILKNVLNPVEIRQKEDIIGLIGITPNDLYPEITTKNVEILLSDNSISLKRYVEYDNAENGIKYASPEVLYSLKKSHIHFPVKFQKHINDYCFLHDSLNGDDKLKEITKINYKETEIRLGKLKTPSLNKKVSEFFAQSDKFVKSYFIHDHLHIAMAHYNGKPLYEKMQYDITIAKCEKVLWEKFTFEDKCKCVLEEAYVIALERKIIPMIFGGDNYITASAALKWSMYRVCTNLCSGWFREFATSNYNKIMEYSNPQYVELFLKKYDDGIIKMNK